MESRFRTSILKEKLSVQVMLQDIVDHSWVVTSSSCRAILLIQCHIKVTHDPSERGEWGELGPETGLLGSTDSWSINSPKVFGKVGDFDLTIPFGDVREFKVHYSAIGEGIDQF